MLKEKNCWTLKFKSLLYDFFVSYNSLLSFYSIEKKQIKLKCPYTAKKREKNNGKDNASTPMARKVGAGNALKWCQG